MKETYILLFVLLVMFSCKKESNQPIVKGKEIELSGQVFDTYTELPLKDINIVVRGWDCKNAITVCKTKETFNLLTDADGKYKMKLFVYDSLEYDIEPKHPDYTLFEDELLKCCGGRVAFTKYDGTRHYSLTDSFYLHKKSHLEFDIKNAKCPSDDSLVYYILFNYKNKKKGEIYDFTFLKKDYTDTFVTIADNMHYIYWKRGSEDSWHNDSIFTPFGKVMKFEIKY